MTDLIFEHQPFFIILAVLLLSVFFYFIFKNSKRAKRLKTLEKKLKELANKEFELLQKERIVDDKLLFFSNAEISASHVSDWFANRLADMEYLHDMKASIQLQQKSRPAPKAAEVVAEMAKEKRSLQKQLKFYEVEFSYLRNVLPWIEDFIELNPSDAITFANYNPSDEESYEKYKNWLSPQEYVELPRIEKYQLALDRYIQNPPSSWHAGIIYERYVGYKCEINGYSVEYTGAIEKLEDMGRDITAIKGNNVWIIQCKRYKNTKLVRENVVFQTYGTAQLYQKRNPTKHVMVAIYTTSTLSDVAKECCEALNVNYCENYPLETYPMIKCNINNGEKIYHLPFDQQYDRVIISPEKGECYVSTVAEAEALGFRRALRWHANQSEVSLCKN